MLEFYDCQSQYEWSIVSTRLIVIFQFAGRYLDANLFISFHQWNQKFINEINNKVRAQQQQQPHTIWMQVLGVSFN